MARADIPVWRGNHNGTYDVQSAPADWQNEVLFKTSLDNWSNGTPILVDGKLIFTAEPDQLICADAKTGAILWQKSNDLYTLHGVSQDKRTELIAYRSDIEKYTQEARKLRNDVRRLETSAKRSPDNKQVAKNLKAKQEEMRALNKKVDEMRAMPFYRAFDMPPAHRTNGYTSYSPHFDGQRIYAQFGFGAVVSYDLEGNRLWTSFVDHPDHGWGGSTMPQIVDGKLIIRADDYHALNPQTGEIIWSTPSEVVFGTPVPFDVEGQSFLFTPRGEVLRTRDGKVLQDGLVKINNDRQWAVFNTPALVDGVLYAANGVGGEDGHVYAFQIPSTVQELTRTGLTKTWHTEIAKDRYYGSPLVHEGLVYVVGQESVVTVLEAKTGEVVYEEHIKGVSGTAYPSLVLADNKIYQGTEDGDMVIFAPGRRFSEIARYELGPYRSTPIFIDKVAYLRTYESLMAVGQL